MDPMTFQDPRLIPLVLGLLVVLWVLGGRAAERRRRARFAALAAASGSQVRAEEADHLVFATTAAGRDFTVRHRLSYKRGWATLSETPLAGVSQLHAVDVRPRFGARMRGAGTDDGDFAKGFVVHDLGMPLRDGWQTARVTNAIRHFFAHELAAGTLSLEEGRLVHRGGGDLRRYDGRALHELLARQAALAEALERVL